MRSKTTLLLLLSVLFLLVSLISITSNWYEKKQKGYSLTFTAADEVNCREYNTLVRNGMNSVKSFFKSAYKNDFTVIVHPNRHSLDSSWQIEFGMPDFKSDCWMVASGIASKIDLISPKKWDTESCEHKYSETAETQKLITHELVHVFHGQNNVSPDFSNTEGIDWFVEGLATFVSGQCDSARIANVKKAMNENKIPASLDDFWKGENKYGLSGSVVMYIDSKYGRAKLVTLLPFNKKTEILAALKTTEPELLNGWKNYMQDK